jgi:hypothetical protein
MRHFYNASGLKDAELIETFASISTLNREIHKYRQVAMNRIQKASSTYTGMAHRK